MELATGGLRFAIPLESAERVLRMVAVSPLPDVPDALIGAINVHGSVVAVVDVCRRLGAPARSYGPGSHILLARSSRRRLALAAEEVRGVLDAAADAVTGPLEISGRGSLAGAVGLPNGIVLIHDLEAFLTADEERRIDRAIERLT